MIMSQSIASSLPPPRAKPVTAAISGLVTLRMCSHCWKRYPWSMSTAEASANSRMSAPAANARALPVSTMQRISSSRSKSSSTVTSSSISARFKALRTSGRFNCTTAFASSRVTTRCCQVMGSPPFDLRRRLIRPPEGAAAVAAVGELLGDVRGPAVGAALRGRAPGALRGPVFPGGAAGAPRRPRPLSHDRCDSLPRRGRARVQGQPVAGVADGEVPGEIAPEVQLLLGVARHLRQLVDQLLPQPLHRGVQFRARDDLIDPAPGQGLLRRDLLAEEEDLPRPPLTQDRKSTRL